MTTSITFEQAEHFYNKNKAELLEILFDELVYNVNYQSEYYQVAVWFDGFVICYQDSDMNSDGKGQLHWNYYGADSIFQDLGEILKNDKRFSKLYASDKVHDYHFIIEFMNDFCLEFAKRNDINNMFTCADDDDDDSIFELS